MFRMRCSRFRRLDDLVRVIGAGVALSSMYPEARSVGRWIRHGWPIAVAYVVGGFVMLAIIGWHPGSTPRGNAPAVTEQGK